MTWSFSLVWKAGSGGSWEDGLHTRASRSRPVDLALARWARPSRRPLSPWSWAGESRTCLLTVTVDKWACSSCCSRNHYNRRHTLDIWFQLRTQTCAPGASSLPSCPAASAMPGSRVGIFPVYTVLMAHFRISFRFLTGGTGSTSMLRRKLSWRSGSRRRLSRLSGEQPLPLSPERASRNPGGLQEDTQGASRGGHCCCCCEHMEALSVSFPLLSSLTTRSFSQEIPSNDFSFCIKPGPQSCATRRDPGR